MPLATAPPDRSLPGRTVPRRRAEPRSFPRPPLLRGGFPRNPKEGHGKRRPLLAVGGVLIVVLCGALGAAVANREPRPTAFLAVARPVPVGMTVTASDLESVSIAPVAGLDAMPLGDAGQVIGHRAAEDLEPGSLLVPGDLASQRGLPAGTALVGTSLAVDQMPAGLATGQRVLVVLSGTAGTGEGSPATSVSVVGTPSAVSTSGSAGSVPSPTGPPGSVLTRATVISVSAPGGSSGQTGTQSTAFVTTLEVPETAAAAVTAASAVGDVSLAVIGGSVGAGTSQ